MSTPKKGFDPLASLFDLPGPEPERLESAKAPVPPPTRDASAAGVRTRSEYDPPKSDFDESTRADDVPEPSLSRTPVPVAAPSAPPAAVAAPSAAAAPRQAGPDPAQLAKILAKAAAAKAAAGVPRPAAPPPAAAAKPAARADARPKVAPRPVAAPAPSLASRLAAAPPPKKALSLEDALAAARVEEAQVAARGSAPPPAAAPGKAAVASPTPPPPKAAVPAASAKPADGMRPDQLADLVAGILGNAVPESGAIYVANALLMDDRGVLTALWKAHRARFAARGDLDGAVACTTVLRGLSTVPIGQLVAAHAVTDRTDWLVWVDLVSGVPLAAFRDARAWFAGG